MATPKNEYPLATTNVYVDGTLTTALRCSQLEMNAGQIPSRAIFLQVFGRDVQGPVALEPMTTVGSFEYGQRVRVDVKEGSAAAKTVFCGWLLKRSDQCRTDKVVWQAFDDRILLQWIAVRGAIVYDVIDKTLRYSPRHPCTFNPGGFWNCTGVEYKDETYPVFTNVACKVQAYESPEASYPAKPGIGVYSPWTPRRALWYLKLWSSASEAFESEVLPGLDITLQSFLSGSAPFSIAYGDIEDMVGSDPGWSGDPLDRKLQELSVQGGSLLNAFGAVLGIAGTHSLYCKPYDATPGSTTLDFKMTGYGAAGSGSDIIVQRGGSVGDLAAGEVNCWDFNFDEDASQVIETSLVEGDAIRVESSLAFVGGKPATGKDYSDDAVSDIIPAWNYAQEVAYLECIHGGVPATPGVRYAKIARNHGDPTTLDICDGSDSTGHSIQKIFARSPAAVQAARDSFPTVFRAWKLNCRSANMQHLLGLVNGDTGGLKGTRPILTEQLQFLVRNLGGGTGVENWLLCRLPIRVQLQNPVTLKMYEVPKDVGARITPDGLIWLDGLSEQASPSPDCVLTGDYMNRYDYKDGRIVLRAMLMNAAFPTDVRVKGLRSNTSIMASALTDAFATGSGKLGRYVDAGKTFKHGIQHVSEPCRTANYYGGANGLVSTPMPLSRDVPPGSESEQANFAAQRVLAKYMIPHRAATFTMIGIQTRWVAGDRIAHVSLKTPPATEVLYTLYAAYFSVTHNFLTQETTIGGLLDIYAN